jgi:hypothetical protein
MNRQDAGKVVACIIAACPSQGSKLAPNQVNAMIATFESLLADLPYEQVDSAVRVLLQTRSWMPSVADIRGAVLELVRGPLGAGGEAWGSVLRAVAREGAYRTPGVDFTFKDPVTQRCVDAFGWPQLCQSDNPVADRARFVDLYDKLAAQGLREVQSPTLAAAKEQRAIGGGIVADLTRRLTGAS